jgi:MFS family permease
LIAAWPTLASALIAMALIGVANSVVDVNAFTILQRLVPDAVMGRVFGAMESAIVTGMGIGAVLMPVLINTVGLRSGLLVIGGAVSALSLVAARGLQRIDKIALAPEGLELLRTVPMLRPLPEAVLERLARHSKTVTTLHGTAVFNEGEVGERFYVIESGTADVTIRGEFIRSLSVGDSFGEIALLRDVPRTATVSATSDLVTRVIERGHFIPAVTGHGEAADEAIR